jgi:hypothetical protein
MSLENARNSLRLAAEPSSDATQLGHMYAARSSLNAAIKSKLADAVLADAGQEQLPLGAPAAPPGPTHTVAGDGVVLTQADVSDVPGSSLAAGFVIAPENTGDPAPSIAEAEAKKAHRRGRGRAHPIDSALPTEAEHDAAVAAAAAAEPEWATV